MSSGSQESSSRSEPLASTGIDGLDQVLGGGLTPHRVQLIEGLPGTGKTTLAFQFLLEGARTGEPVLHVSLVETVEELQEVAASHGWSLDGVHIHQVLSHGDVLDPEEQYTVFHPAELELTETTKSILEQVERLKPVRVVYEGSQDPLLSVPKP
jgi:circadian clock protein KaiC